MNICDCLCSANTDPLCQLSSGDQSHSSRAALQGQGKARLCRSCTLLAEEVERLASCCQRLIFPFFLITHTPVAEGILKWGLEYRLQQEP